MFISASQLIQALKIAGHDLLHNQTAKQPHGCLRLSHHAKQRHIWLISTGPRAVHEGSLNEGWRAGFGAALKMYRNIQLSSSVKSS